MITKMGAAIVHMIDGALNTELYARLIQLRLRFHTSNYHFKKEDIALVHVPKTAGTTLYTMLKMDELNRFKNINRHRPVSRFCPPGEYQYITVMRNPADRVWSHYQMILRTPHGRFHHVAQEGLKSYLNKCWMGRNMACRYYAGNVRKEPDSASLQLARENLSKFLCILAFDTIGDDLTRLLNDFDIPLAPIPNKRNVSYVQPSQEEHKLIESYNKQDIALFNEFSANRISLEQT